MPHDSRGGSKICITPLGIRALVLSVLPTSFPVNVCDLIQPFSPLRVGLQSLFSKVTIWLCLSAQVLRQLWNTHRNILLLLINSLLGTRTQIFLSIVRFLFSKYLYSTTPHYGSLLCNHSCKISNVGYDCINSMSTIGSKWWCTSVFK